MKAACLLLLAFAAVTWTFFAPGVQAQTPDPFVAPVTRLSADGLTATDGRRTLTVSKAIAISETGEAIEVRGSGYDLDKGIYLTFCKVPAKNEVPTPCGGSMDSGSGTAAWISSNPPSYGQGLTIPYGPGGSFTYTLSVSTKIGDSIDCRTSICAVVSRSDHTRSSDRTQDVFVPISFGSQKPATGLFSGLEVTQSREPGSTSPKASLSLAGRKATSGALSLSASEIAIKDSGANVKVSGRGFDESKGVYVALCATPSESPALGPCAGGSRDLSAWVSSNPPAYGKDLTIPYKDSGAFDVSLRLNPVIDAKTDCRLVACAIAVRADGSPGSDRSQEIALPVSFGAVDAKTSESSSLWKPWLVPALGGIFLAFAGAAYLLQRRRLDVRR